MSYIYSPFLYDGEPRHREESAMNNTGYLTMSEKDAATQALRDIAARNNGEPTEAERRQHAIDVLAKKTPQQQPASRKQANNPASQALVDGIRGRR